ncbi:MAG: TPM domain-containing protein, partial [Pseudomonadota bacterium]|nr:TPM domain-containing protein [Pseudomonadota bacterium]
MKTHRMRASALALSLLATGCGQSPAVVAAQADVSAAGSGADANLMAAQIADTLQACSYDGSPVQFGMGGEAPRDCRDIIAQVMNFTGLPQNFDVTEADVPNAAAAILLDEEKIPHRVIAFNPEFVELVRRATGGNPWSAVSIMAHEAGHHLAGHTIQPGGSQPPIELEADKFSGFVLYKMGASRNDALIALNTLVPVESRVGSTHPGRRQRVAALTEGWDQACAQTGRSDCTNGKPGSTPPPGIVNTIAQSPASRPGVIGGVAPPATPRPTPPASAAAAQVTELPKVVVLPPPDAKALPSKGMQFVYDEYGFLDPKIAAQFERQMYEHARQSGVEIVTMLVKDLHGMSAEAYGWAMLRQLRVGK